MNGAVKPAFEKRLIDFAQLPLGFGILDTDNDAVRMEEIRDSSAFTEELRVGGHAKRSTISAAIDLKGMA